MHKTYLHFLSTVNVLFKLLKSAPFQRSEIWEAHKLYPNRLLGVILKEWRLGGWNSSMSFYELLSIVEGAGGCVMIKYALLLHGPLLLRSQAFTVSVIHQLDSSSLSSIKLSLLSTAACLGSQDTSTASTPSAHFYHCLSQ